MGGAVVHASLCTKQLAFKIGLMAVQQQPRTKASLDTQGRLAGAEAALQLEQPPGWPAMGLVLLYKNASLKSTERRFSVVFLKAWAGVAV